MSAYIYYFLPKMKRDTRLKENKKYEIGTALPILKYNKK